MLELVLNAIVLGMILSVFIGPVFFLLLETSIKDGFNPALRVSFGALTSDVLYIILTLMILKGLFTIKIDRQVFGIIGGVAFLVFGVFYLVKKPADNRTKLFKSGANPFIKSFIFNSINPSVMVFWFGAITYGTLLFPDNTSKLIAYIIIALIVTLSIDVLKIYLSAKIKRAISPAVLSKVNKLTGIALIFFGVKMILTEYVFI